MLKVGQFVKGYINCGTANPFYNKCVLLKVVFVIDSERVEVTTVDSAWFEHNIDRYSADHKFIASETVYENHTYTNWLNTDKPYEVVA